MSFAKCIEILTKYYLSFLLGIRTTLIVAISGTLFGLMIGLFVGGFRAIRLDKTASGTKKTVKKILDIVGRIYIELKNHLGMTRQNPFGDTIPHSSVLSWNK